MKRPSAQRCVNVTRQTTAMVDTATADNTWAWRLCTLDPNLQQIDAEDAEERLRKEVVQSYKNKAFYPTYVKFARAELKRDEECDKPTVEGLEQYKRFLRAFYLEAVSVIDKDLELLRNQLEDESISETRRAVIPQHIEDTRKELKKEDEKLNEEINEIDSVIADIKGIEDKVNGLKELASNQAQKRRRTALSLEQNVDDLRYALDAYETRREYYRHRTEAGNKRRNHNECLYSVHSVKRMKTFKRQLKHGYEEEYQEQVQHNLIIHPAGVVGCDRSNAGGSLGSRYGYPVSAPQWKPEWGAEKPFCDCDSFSDFVTVDTSDLLYSALRSVERALSSKTIDLS